MVKKCQKIIVNFIVCAFTYLKTKLAHWGSCIWNSHEIIISYIFSWCLCLRSANLSIRESYSNGIAVNLKIILQIESVLIELKCSVMQFQNYFWFFQFVIRGSKFYRSLGIYRMVDVDLILNVLAFIGTPYFAVMSQQDDVFLKNLYTSVDLSDWISKLIY